MDLKTLHTGSQYGDYNAILQTGKLRHKDKWTCYRSPSARSRKVEYRFPEFQASDLTTRLQLPPP